jgi:protein glucosyltransferase
MFVIAKKAIHSCYYHEVIPILSTLNTQKIKVLENDKVARQIAKRGLDFIMEHLKMDDIYCYWEEFIKEYTKLLKYKPKLEKNFVRIKWFFLIIIFYYILEV